MKLTEYEEQSIIEVKKWEQEKHKGFHKKVLDLTSKPVDFLIKKIGPEKFSIFEKAIEGTVNKLLYASTYTVNHEVLIQRAHEHGVKIKDISDLKKCDMALLDQCNRKHINYHEKAAAIQGAVLGLGGAFVAVADITTILVQDYHMVQEIAFCYGFDPNDIIEKEIILRIIEAAIGGSEIKFKALQEIDALKEIQNKEPNKTVKKGVSVLGAKALEEYIEDLTVALLVRLVPRSFPIISMVVSAHSNHEIMEHSGKTAFMVYRKKFIERKETMVTRKPRKPSKKKRSKKNGGK